MPSGVAYAVLGGLGAVENVLPVLPADTAIGAGVFLSHYGTVSAVAVFVMVWTANVGSAAAVYAAMTGALHGERKESSPARSEIIKRMKKNA